MDDFLITDKFSELAKSRIAASDIAAIGLLRSQYQGISLAVGEPDSAFYPTAELREAFVNSLEEPDILGYYPDDFGYAPLREWISLWMKSEKTAPSWADANNILLTHGSSEGINNVAELFIDEGDIVAAEEATYAEAVMNFRKQGASCVGVRMDEDGIIPSELEKLSAHRKVKLLYTIPNFQNPTGRTTTLERRLAILDICKRRDILILEDDPYRYLSYDEEVPDSYLYLAGNWRNVIYTGSFSKILTPGMRIGWAVVPPNAVDKFNCFQICNGNNQQALTFKAAHLYLRENDIGERIKFLRREYRKRRDTLVSEIRAQLEPLGLKTNRPRGGFFLWGTIDGIDDMNDFAKYAIINHGVAVIPGASFIVDGKSGKNTCRMSISKVTPETAKEGCRRLAAAIKSYRR